MEPALSDEFRLPLHFEDIERQRTICLDNVEGASTVQLLRLVEELGWLRDANDDSFAALYIMLRGYLALRADEKKRVVQVVQSGVEALLSDGTQRQSAKIVAFFASSLLKSVDEDIRQSDGKAGGSAASAAVKGGGARATAKDSCSDACEQLLQRLLKLAGFEALWPNAVPDDDCAGFVWRHVLVVLENPRTAKQDGSCKLAFDILTIAATKWSQGEALLSAMIHMVGRHAHAPSTIASFLLHVETYSQQKAFVDAAIVEFCAAANSESVLQDSATARALGELFANLSNVHPCAVRRNVRSKIAPLLDLECYSLRNGVVDALAQLLQQRDVVPEGDDVNDFVHAQLLSRVHDVNAFTRSHTLQAWASIVRSDVLSPEDFVELAGRASERIFDRAAAVRRSALQVLGDLLRHNPFGPSLPCAGIARALAADAGGAPSSGSQAEPAKGSADAAEHEGVAALCGAQKQRRALLTVAHELATCMDRAVEAARALLRSASVTDNVEAIAFILVARDFALDGAAAASRSLLPLIFSREKSVRDAVVKAHEHILLDELGEDESLHGKGRRKGALHGHKDALVALAFAIVNVSNGATVGERVCVNELVGQLASAEGDAQQILLSPAFVQVLWDITIGKASGVALPMRTGACALLRVVVTLKPNIFPRSPARGNALLKLVLGEDEAHDKPTASKSSGTRYHAELSREACATLPLLFVTGSSEAEAAAEALCRGLVPVDPPATDRMDEGADAERPSRLTPPPLLEQTLNAVYQLSLRPETMVAVAVRSLARAAIQSRQASQLGVLVFVVGHAAVKQLVFNEAAVKELSTRDAMGEQQRDGSGEGPARDDGDGPDNDDADGVQQAKGLASSVANAEREDVLARSELEIVGEGSLLGQYAPLMAQLAMDARCPPSVRANATLSLCKLMAVQELLCERYVRVIFSLLGGMASAPALLRANAVVALGDLAFRYPTLLEPWSPRLYACLRDDNVLVRRNALATLSHLILNDMVKVKGQIVELALSLHDDDECVSKLARLFFHELSRKGGQLIFNVLPDTMSCLSQRHDLDTNTYRELIQFLMTFLDRGRHAEGMVEKLLPRFRAAETTRDHRDLAFVLSLLPFNERALRRLLDGFRAIADKLADDEVYRSMLDIVAKGRRLPKTDRMCVEELYTCIQHVRAHLTNEHIGSTSADDDKVNDGGEDKEGLDSVLERLLAVSVTTAPPKTPSRKVKPARHGLTENTPATANRVDGGRSRARR